MSQEKHAKKDDVVKQDQTDKKDNIEKQDHADKKDYSKKKSNKYNSKKVMKDLSSNYWAISTVVLAVVLLIFVFSPSSTAGVIGEKEASDIIINFAEAQGLDAQLVDVKYENGLYEVTVTIQDQDVPVYLTSDGKSLVPSVIPIAEVLEQAEQAAKQTPAAQQDAPQDIPTSDKPTAELFVMTHCPYGTQAEKGFLPALEALSDVADVKIRFVHYFMHTPDKEDVETPRQVCIREEQPERFNAYLKCFLGKTGIPADALACEEETGVDSDALAECISNGKADEYYAEDSALSEKYGVRGSPTLVINGAQAQYGRNAESYKTGICGAFNDAPDICSETLDATNPSPGFGYAAGSASASAAQCA